jgi:Rieske Fe-S protein
MNRRDFIVNSCAACLSVAALSTVVSSCQSTRYISGRITDDGLIVKKDEFKIKKGDQVSYRSYIIIRNDALQYPVCVYRFSEQEYSALWMRCTHQGTELQASGEYLQCPAHGSEFNNKGDVTNGPADKNLRTFLVFVTESELFIDMRKV